VLQWELHTGWTDLHGYRLRRAGPPPAGRLKGMSTKNILLIGGTLNQTKAMVAIGNELTDHNCYHTPFYCDGHLLRASQRGQLDFTVLAGALRERTVEYMRQTKVPIDDRGEARGYDLIVTCSDLILQDNIEDKRIVLIQEGLTEREGFLYWLVTHLGVPRAFANTAAFGLSDGYEVFCVASVGARNLFRAKGIRESKMVVTGIPNFDEVNEYLNNDFPYRDFVLICTSNARETFKWHDRMRFLRDAVNIAAGRPVIFKLHPAEQHDRATREIRSMAPDALIMANGNTEHMIANCAALVAQYSTVAFTAALLGKEVHSYIEPDYLRQALPIQNGGTSARNIAEVCRACFDSNPVEVDKVRARVESGVEQPPSSADVHVMPQAGEQSLLYSFTQGIRHALRPTRSRSRTDGVDLPRATVTDHLRPPRPINPVD
jgi:hypothetical protein